MMRFWVILAGVVGVAWGQTVEDCSSTGDSSILVKTFQLAEGPISIPGKLRVKFNIEVTKALDNFDAEVKLEKVMMGVPYEIPCITPDNPIIGSCLYKDLCGMMENIWGDRECPIILQCKCPIEPKRYTLPIAIPIDVPALPGNVVQLIEGTYRIKLRFLDSATGAELSCNKMELIVEDVEEL